MALNARQKLFVQAYLRDPNAKRAAVAAGYSAKTAETQGPRLFRNVQVRAAIDRAQDKLTARAELTAELVIADVRRLAQKAETAGEYHAAIRGNELLGKHLRMWSDKLEVIGRLTIEELVTESNKKAEGES